jgi:Arc/MetJ-type ribon-helix-helix transcriptional regulator
VAMSASAEADSGRLSLRVSGELLRRTERFAERHGYLNRSELIREAIRRANLSRAAWPRSGPNDVPGPSTRRRASLRVPARMLADLEASVEEGVFDSVSHAIRDSVWRAVRQTRAAETSHSGGGE